MTVLVTGGAGFIGSNLVKRLLDLRCQIIVIDNLSTGFRKNLNSINKGLVFYQRSINGNLNDIFKKHRPQVVFHLAAQIDVRRSMTNPQQDAKTNILGSLNVLECSCKFGVKKIIYSSTGGVMYGSPKKIPVSEKQEVKPLCAYGLSKYIFEHYLRLYYESYGLKYLALRYGNVYGPGQNPYGEAGVVAIFCQQILSKQQPTLFDHGQQKRDYIYIDDVVEANILASTSKQVGVYNIGTGVGTTAKYILAKLEKICQQKINAKLAPRRLGEIKQISLNAQKAKKDLKWTPQVDLKTGLTKTFNYFKKL